MKGIEKFTIVLVIIFIVSGVLASSLFFSSVDWDQFDRLNYFSYLNYSKKSSTQGINHVNLGFTNENIVVQNISGNEFVFNLTGYYAKITEGNYPELKVEKLEDSLDVYISYPKKIYFFGISSRDSNLWVGVPENYKEDFSINVISGNINVDKIEVNNLEINSVSGEVECRDTKSSENFVLKTISGGIYIENSEKIDSLITTSGNIEIKNLIIDNKLNIETISGDISLDLIEGSSVDLEFKSVSGDLTNNFGEIYGGEDKVYIKTTSGDLRIS